MKNYFPQINPQDSHPLVRGERAYRARINKAIRDKRNRQFAERFGQMRLPLTSEEIRNVS